MTNNEDALYHADVLERYGNLTSADHLRRLVRENEAQAALLRQALTAFRAAHGTQATIPMLDAAMAAIQQFLEARS